MVWDASQASKSSASPGTSWVSVDFRPYEDQGAMSRLQVTGDVLGWRWGNHGADCSIRPLGRCRREARSYWVAAYPETAGGGGDSTSVDRCVRLGCGVVRSNVGRFRGPHDDDPSGVLAISPCRACFGAANRVRTPRLGRRWIKREFRRPLCGVRAC